MFACSKLHHLASELKLYRGRKYFVFPLVLQLLMTQQIKMVGDVIWRAEAGTPLKQGLCCVHMGDDSRLVWHSHNNPQLVLTIVCCFVWMPPQRKAGSCVHDWADVLGRILQDSRHVVIQAEHLIRFSGSIIKGHMRNILKPEEIQEPTNAGSKSAYIPLPSASDHFGKLGLS